MANLSTQAKEVEQLPFTAWELETMAAALRQYAEMPGFAGGLAQQQMRALSTRLQMANPEKKIRCGHCGAIVGSKQACVQPWTYDSATDRCVNSAVIAK